MPLVVKGLRELVRADQKATKETRLGVKPALREAAEPVRREAENLAGRRIRNMGRSPAWSGMRVGVTTRVVYVAPKKRGARKRAVARLRRPNLAALLLDRAMTPALDLHLHDVEQGLERMLERIGRDWGASA